MPAFSRAGDPWLPLLAALVAGGCGQTPTARLDGSSGTADAPAAAEVLPAGACRFAHTGNPDSYAGSEDVINVPLERLEAPPGGLWWIRERLEPDTVVVMGPAGPISLQVVPLDTVVAQASFSTLRVPDLPPGIRLTMGGRVLVVGQPLPRPNFEALVLRYVHRPELGGTGVTIDLPANLRRRVMVLNAWVGPPGANVQVGVHVLHQLLLSDLPAICNPSTAEGDPVFVPLWTGETGQGLGVTLLDADDLSNSRFRRLCQTPNPSSACLPCHGC
jgi:hypothetical protein